MKTNSIWDRICEEARSEDADNEVKQVIAKWENHDVTLKANGKRQLEGYIMLFKFWQELGYAVDPSLPNHLTPQCFDPTGIAKLFGFPVEEFAELLPDMNAHLIDGLGSVETEVARLSEALERALPIIEEQVVLDPSKLNETQSRLYDTTSDTEALSAKMICGKAGKKHSGYTRGLMSQMVKNGFLRKVPGGYVRVQTRHLP